MHNPDSTDTAESATPVGMVERVARAIEVAARKSVPWPDDEQHQGEDENGEDIFRASTLEEFVDRTYLHGEGMADVFRVASEEGAQAAIEATGVVELREALEDLLSWFPEKPSDPEWRIKGGGLGADDAINHARQALTQGETP